MSGQKIMIVEDDPDIRDMIRLYLEKNNYNVILVDNGEEALKRAQSEPPDLAILDLMLPGKDGFEVCRDLRSISSVPILFLSCKREETDKIKALNLGGDDFITKPFSPNELIARVRSHLRRPYLRGEERPNSTTDKLTAGPLSIDRLSRVVRLYGHEISLSRKEFDLLFFLALHSEQTFSHEQLFREIWGQECFNDTRTIIVHISNLRKKIEPDPASPRFIMNVHGVGYKFVKPSGTNH